jgi:hypothetical protein
MSSQVYKEREKGKTDNEERMKVSRWHVGPDRAWQKAQAWKTCLFPGTGEQHSCTDEDAGKLHCQLSTPTPWAALHYVLNPQSLKLAGTVIQRPFLITSFQVRQLLIYMEVLRRTEAKPTSLHYSTTNAELLRKTIVTGTGEGLLSAISAHDDRSPRALHQSPW